MGSGDVYKRQLDNNNNNKYEEFYDDDNDDECKNLDWSTSLLPFPTIISRTRKKKGPPYEPIIEWNNDSIDSKRIIYPQALTDIQLNAFVRNNLNLNVRGKIVYNPSRGTILPAGTHEIIAIFIPENTSHYRSVSLTKIINVARGTPKLSWIPPSYELSVGIGLGTGLPKEYLQCKCLRLKGGKFYYTHKIGDKLDRGYRTIGCRYEPSEKNSLNYKHGFIQITIHITGYIPEMNWPTIKPSAYPLKLSKLHYSIKPKDSKILGHFEYDPPLLTLFPTGNYELKATFFPEDTYRYMKSSFTNTVEITKGIPTLEWPQPPSVYEDTILDERVLRCNCIDNIAGTFTYAPSHGFILSPGTLLLKVEFVPDDKINYESAKAEVTITIHKKIKPVVCWEEPEYITHPAPLARSELSAEVSGRIRGRFIYEPQLGTILPAGTHILKVKFISETIGKSDSEGSTTLEVRKGVARLLWDSPYPILEGQPITTSTLSCICTNDIKGTFTYSIKIGSILPAGKHKLYVTFEPDEENSKNFIGAEGKQVLEVRTRGKKRPTITWVNPTDIIHPQPLTDKHLNATCSATGELNYFPGLDTILDVGEHILSVSFQPLHKDICLPMSGEVIIKVLPGIPTITWNPIANIIYGQELSEDQLNAECLCCDGEFEYNPDFHEILDSGDHILTAKFYPDTPNYLETEVTSAILVQRGRAIVEWKPQLPDLNDKHQKPIEYPFFINKEAHLNAIVVYPKNVTGKFGYSVQHNDLLTAGIHTITCRFYPDDIINMYSGDASVTIEVNKAPARVNWKNGLRDYFFYGTSLSEKHYGTKMLEKIDGQWSYEPPLNYVLEVGEHSISATFTPSDLDNYKPTTLVRILRVKDLQL